MINSRTTDAFALISALVGAKAVTEAMTPRIIDKTIDELMPELLKDLHGRGETLEPYEVGQLKALAREYVALYARTGKEPSLDEVMRSIMERTVQQTPQTLRGVAHAIATDMQCLQQFPQRTKEEVTELGSNIPFRVLRDPVLFVQWARTNCVAMRDAYALLSWADSMRNFLRDVEPVGDVTYEEVRQAAELAQTHSIILHRVNYLLHEQMLVVYDLLESQRKNRLRFKVKKHYLRAEEAWDSYEKPRQKVVEVTAWRTLQDHLRLAADALQPRLQKVYEAARDRMIFLRLPDVELRSRIVVALTVGKVQHLSFVHFFDDFKRDMHCDLRRLYEQDDLLPMTRAFADMVQELGINISADSYGMPVLQDFDIDNSVRTGWAWKSFMRDLRDVDLMDETAKHAIELNPKVRQDYYAVLKEEEENNRQKEREQMAEKLSEKFKVTKAK